MYRDTRRIWGVHVMRCINGININIIVTYVLSYVTTYIKARIARYDNDTQSWLITKKY